MYIQWFDWRRTGDWQDRRKTVEKCFTAMADWMSGARITYCKSDGDENCDKGLIGWTPVTGKFGTGEKGTITLCKRAFDDVDLRIQYWFASAELARAYILIHEISHAVFSTEDAWYFWPIVQSLSTFDPGLAVKNAENYANFAMRRDTKDLPYQPPFGETIAINTLQKDYCFLGVQQDNSIRGVNYGRLRRSERFLVTPAGEGGPCFALKSLANNKYIQVLNDGALKAISTAVAGSETFEWVDPSSEGECYVALRAIANRRFVDCNPDTLEAFARNSEPALFRVDIQNDVIWLIDTHFNMRTMNWKGTVFHDQGNLDFCHVAFDSEDTMWGITSSLEVVKCTGPNAFTNYGYLGGLKVGRIAFDAENNMWGTTEDYRVGRFDLTTRSWKDLSFRGDWKICYIAFDATNTMYAIDSGYQLGRWEAKTQSWRRLLFGNRLLVAITFDAENKIWAIDNNFKLFRWDFEKQEWFDLHVPGMVMNLAFRK
jgi:hypothetical protein